jgi:DNA polymerase V
MNLSSGSLWKCKTLFDEYIKMGQPVFECRGLIEQHHIQVFSSNYPLYADMSDRVMQTLATFSPRVEVYSIDEAWLDLSHVPKEQLHVYGHQIRETVWRFTGIPVSVGIASTKTLTKVANEVVKKNPVYRGVLSLMHISEEVLDELLETLPVEDVWGIGPRYARLLQSRDILTAKNLKYTEQRWVCRHLTVVGEQTVLELRGIACIPLETRAKPKKGIMTAKSFGRSVESREELEEALATYTARAAEKVRKQGCCFQYQRLSPHQCVSKGCAAIWQQPHTGAALSHFLYTGSVQRRARYVEKHLSRGVRVQELRRAPFKNRVPGRAAS